MVGTAGVRIRVPDQGRSTRLRNGVRDKRQATRQALVHRCRAATAACARARLASRGPSPQTLRFALIITGGRPRVSWGPPRRGEARARVGFRSTTEPHTLPRPAPQPKGVLRETR